MDRQPYIPFRLRGQRGYSLIELVVVLIIVGILASVALKSLRTAGVVAKTEQTRHELDKLAWAITGNPERSSGGVRSDYGYIGDVGALPPNLDALVTNPGYATWKGPYIRDD
ncbi:MAG: type II secretion system protein, partial [Candidatus Zixiibacteriota bacterium]